MQERAEQAQVGKAGSQPAAASLDAPMCRTSQDSPSRSNSAQVQAQDGRTQSLQAHHGHSSTKALHAGPNDVSQGLDRERSNLEENAAAEVDIDR